MDSNKVTRQELEEILSLSLAKLEEETGSSIFDLSRAGLYYHTDPEKKFPAEPTIYPDASSVGHVLEEVEFIHLYLRRGVDSPRAALRKLAIILEYISHNSGYKKK